MYTDTSGTMNNPGLWTDSAKSLKLLRFTIVHESVSPDVRFDAGSDRSAFGTKPLQVWMTAGLPGADGGG